MIAERAGKPHSKATHNHLWKVVAIRIGAWGLEESKCHPGLQKGQEGETSELPATQPHLNPWEDDGTPRSGGYLYLWGWQEGAQK